MQGWLALNLPIVDTSNVLSGVKVPRVVVDEAHVARLAVAHFRERGFRNFAYFSDSIHRAPAGRGEEFTRVLAGDGLECIAPPCRKKNDQYSRVFHFEVVEWLRSLKRPMAVFAANDVIAGWLIGICRNIGIRVPEDIAILGVGDDEFYCLNSFPNVSSIALPGRKVGYEAARILHQAMNRSGRKKNGSLQMIPSAHLVTRHSTDVYALEHPIAGGALGMASTPQDYGCIG